MKPIIKNFKQKLERRRRKKEEVLAFTLLETWEDNQESMPKMAAFSVACEMLGIEEQVGWELIAEHCCED